MRTTLTIDERIAAQLREIAHRSGRSLGAVVNEALRAGIPKDRIATCPKPYRLDRSPRVRSLEPAISTRCFSSPTASKTKSSRKLQLRK